MGVIAGVNYIHSYSPTIVHGDLKPVSNAKESFIPDGTLKQSAEGKYSYRRSAERQALRFRNSSHTNGWEKKWPHHYIELYGYRAVSII